MGQASSQAAATTLGVRIERHADGRHAANPIDEKCQWLVAYRITGRLDVDWPVSGGTAAAGPGRTRFASVRRRRAGPFLDDGE